MGETDVAIIGISGRFPGAASPRELWSGALSEESGMRELAETELKEAGVSEALLSSPRYVRRTGVLDGAEGFDAEFFGISAREADRLDPQHRLFLECAWLGLEDAGCAPSQLEGLVGVYAGVGLDGYSRLVEAVDPPGPDESPLERQMASERDFVATRVAYKLGLGGPAVTVQSACSTSLVAVHLACQGLLSGDADVAIAGGARIVYPYPSGYLHREGEIFSPDGVCRAFDDAANGTVPGSGVAAVVLKRLTDALADGDSFYAVIKGSAVNNDGSRKAGFTAPSVQGQAEVIAGALAAAGVEPDSVRYVETHGTGTPLGDPIEVEALRQALERRGHPGCYLGALKPSIGHLDAAAGAAALIKAALTVKEGVIPPTLHFEEPSSQIDFGSLQVADRVIEWPDDDVPRRAGVSSFGVGGTNAHVVIEEPPPLQAKPSSREPQLLVISARDEEAVLSRCSQLADVLAADEAPPLADVSATLAQGREPLDARTAVVAGEESVEAALRAVGAADVRAADPAGPAVVFAFPGQGSQFAGMARGLYRSERVFREVFDECLGALAPEQATELSTLILADGDAEADRTLSDTRLAQPALFATEYALARQLIEWGVRPAALIGHSVGEYVAACLAGVFGPAAGIELIARRGELMAAAPPGRMLAVALPEDELRRTLPDEVAIAAVNAPSTCTVAGPIEAIERVEAELGRRKVATRPLQTSHAFHSAQMDEVVDPLVEAVRAVGPVEPELPYLANRTGTWAAVGEASDPQAWGRHSREAVRFADCVAALAARHRDAVVVELGPGRALSALIGSNPDAKQLRLTAPALGEAKERDRAPAATLQALGDLWTYGVPVDWRRFFAGEERVKRPLPGYPFRRRAHWIGRAPAAEGEPLGASTASQRGADATARLGLEEMVHEIGWRRAPRLRPRASRPRRWLALVSGPMGRHLVWLLRTQGDSVVTVEPGLPEASSGQALFVSPADASADLGRALALSGTEGEPLGVIHAWASEGAYAQAPMPPDLASHLSLMDLARAVAEGRSGAQLTVLTLGAYDVGGAEPISPHAAMLGGTVASLARELPGGARHIDVDAAADPAAAAEAVLDELSHTDPAVAIRGTAAWLPSPEPVVPGGGAGIPIRADGVYVFTGGLGAIGLELAQEVVERGGRKLALLSRDASPARTATVAGELQALRARGATVEMLEADASDREGLTGCLDEVRSRLGPVAGIVHAAGIAGGRLAVNHQRAESEPVLAPKVSGAQALAEFVSRSPEVDFLVLCSSVDAVLGAPGAADYAAANAYMDALAYRCRQQGERRVISIGWDAWREVGMATRHAAGTAEGTLALGLSNQEGRSLFGRALAAGSPHLLISTVPPAQRLVVSTPVVALPSPEPVVVPDEAPAPDAGTGTSGDLAAAVTAIWAELLGRPDLSPDEDVFNLGAHSLMATQVVPRLRQVLGSEVGVRTVIEARTGAQLAAALEPGQGGGEASPAVAEAASEGPLSPLQERIWMLHELSPESLEFIVPFGLRIRGPLDARALERAIAGILNRHDALRTVFRATDEEPVQEVRPPGDFELGFEDLGPGTSPEEALAVASEFALQPFDLGRGPLFRCKLLQLDPDDYLLAISFHHLVFDGWSLGIFHRELAELYRAEATGAATALEPLPNSYLEVSQRQREAIGTPSFRRSLAFWLGHLEGVPALDLPSEGRRPPVRSERGAAVPFELDPGLLDHVDRLAAERGATRYIVLLAVTAVVLGRYSEQDDFAIGSMMANRTQPGSQELIGFFVNLNPIRADLSGDPSFLELVERMRGAALDAYEHSEVPFDMVLAELDIERDRSRTPVVQAALILEDEHPGEIELEGVEVEPVAIPWPVAQFDVTLRLVAVEGRFHGFLEYSTDLFNEASAAGMADSLAAVLERLSVEPETRLSEVPLVPEQQRQAHIEARSGPAAPLGEKLLHEVVAEWAEREGDAPAVSWDGGTLSYAELEARSNQVAHLLRDRGVGPDSVVGICIPRSVETVVAIIGALKVGAAFLPLEADTPAARFADLLADARPAVVLVGADAPAALLEAGAETLEVTGDSRGLEGLPTEAVDVATRPDNLISIYYTSGSTGKPKGVASTHAGWLNRIAWMQRQHGLDRGESVLFKTTLTFDDSAVEVFWPLMVGGRIAVLGGDLHRDPAAILERAVAEQVSVIQFVPSVLDLFLDLLDDEALSQLSRLRHVVSSGEALTPELVAKFEATLGRNDVLLHNQWGATEVSIDSTLHTCVPLDATSGRPVPIGHPIDNNRVYVLDPGLRPLPVGVPGELFLGGVGLARGYLGDPRRTALAFVPDPFVPGERMYRTGDRGRENADGSVTFLGRGDNQVKLRGMRIELGEVEQALGSHPGVRAAAVIAREYGPGDKRLVAFYVGEESAPSPEELRRHAAALLPPFMVPSAFVPLEALPQTASGKLDRRALRPPSLEPVETAVGRAPETEVETALAEIWSELLDREQVGVDLDFFAAGGYSLLATRAITRMRARFDHPFPLSLVFDNPTIAEAARAVEAELRTERQLSRNGDRENSESTAAVAGLREKEE